MHSIRMKITFLTIAAILICACLIGIVSIMTVKLREEQSSEQLMDLICETKRDKINSFLDEIEESADTISHFVYESLDVVELSEGGVIGAAGSGRSLKNRVRTKQQKEKLDHYLQGHLDKAEELFDTIANNNNSIISYYYRINPEISDTAQGFWYSRHDTMRFKKLGLTDISKYSPDDNDHVGWYYLPLERGRPSWMDPYENKNLGEAVVSYLVPIYKSGTFIGVLGMDISYSALVDQIRDLDVLETGYAFLIDGKGKIMYHPDIENGNLVSDVSSELQAASGDPEGKKLITYGFDGVRKKAAWATLSNDLILVVSAPVSEIDKAWKDLSWSIIFLVLIVLGIFIYMTMMSVKSITTPLEQLVGASRQISSGNYDVDLTYDGDDEIGILTKAFSQMADDMQVFIKDLNSKAYKDALTRVRNKGAFDIITRRMDETIRKSDPENAPEFALIMFDCNDLKVINDSYGHEKGDIYLQKACGLICKIFAHSPVFRIGGDEFVVILENGDLQNRKELEREFDKQAEDINRSAEDEWEKISVARGIVVYDPFIDDTMESVLRRADKVMYLNKKRYKNNRGIRRDGYRNGEGYEI